MGNLKNAGIRLEMFLALLRSIEVSMLELFAKS